MLWRRNVPFYAPGNMLLTSAEVIRELSKFGNPTTSSETDDCSRLLKMCFTV